MRLYLFTVRVWIWRFHARNRLDSLSQKITVARKKAQQSLSDDALPDSASDDALDELEAKSSPKSEDLPFK